jgi:hypothetical protein
VAKYFGVVCKGCSKNIPLSYDRSTLEEGGKLISFFSVNEGNLKCPECRATAKYDQSDAVRFEAEDGLILQ